MVLHDLCSTGNKTGLQPVSRPLFSRTMTIVKMNVLIKNHREIFLMTVGEGGNQPCFKSCVPQVKHAKKTRMN